MFGDEGGKEMSCFLFHKWGKWEQYTKHTMFIVASNNACEGKHFPAVQARQRRQCKKCLKVQDERVIDALEGA